MNFSIANYLRNGCKILRHNDCGFPISCRCIPMKARSLSQVQNKARDFLVSPFNVTAKTQGDMCKPLSSLNCKESTLWRYSLPGTIYTRGTVHKVIFIRSNHSRFKKGEFYLIAILAAETVNQDQATDCRPHLPGVIHYRWLGPIRD
jgi:hypothetical protein